MGFAFNMDDFVDIGAYDGINTGWNPINPNAAREAMLRRKEQRRTALIEVVTQYARASKVKDAETVKRTKSQIQTELNDLESQLYYYRVCEKNLLRVKNNFEIRSIVVMDIIDGLLEFYNDSCNSIIELQEEIRNNSNFNFKGVAKEVNETNIRKELTQSIFSIVDGGLTKGLPLSREMFRNLVKDLEKVLEALLYGKPVKKKQVEEYFKTNCNKHAGMIVCQNCQKPMFADIPYCFNCFDGRYS